MFAIIILSSKTANFVAGEVSYEVSYPGSAALPRLLTPNILTGFGAGSKTAFALAAVLTMAGEELPGSAVIVRGHGEATI
jgi:hypothetical protein